MKKPIVYIVTACWGGTPEDDYDYMSGIYLNKQDAEDFCRAENQRLRQENDPHERNFYFYSEAHQVK